MAASRAKTTPRARKARSARAVFGTSSEVKPVLGLSIDLLYVKELFSGRISP